MANDQAELEHFPSSSDDSNSIQAIDRDAVHRICSGQVVLNLATAVKELVENSLDAGATSIEIRLKEYGSELVEVIDNGCGVEETNFQGLTLKHHTSKLREFSDLLDVETFGFRGEALSSLCALSELSVGTRHSSSSIGTKLTFDSRGLIVSKAPYARQVGTTVSLVNLFSPLPVRQKEFLRNLKREFHKMTQLLYAYCLISRGVKILCSNQSKKGQKTVITSTQGSSTFKGNITCIFGAKQASSLLDLEQKHPHLEHLEEVGLSEQSVDGSFVLEGCISSCAHGQGRSAPDRQFYYINNRPCEPSKVSKVVNEVYHQFNIHQFPFVFMNIKTNRSGVDVNVTPDKRQIFLEYEKLLLATVKTSILGMFENIPSTYQFNNVSTPPGSHLNSSSPISSEHKTSSPSLGRFTSLLKTFRHSPSSNDEGSKGAPDTELTNFKPSRGVKRSLECTRYDKDGKKQLSLSAFVLPNEKCRPEKKSKEDDCEGQPIKTEQSSEDMFEQLISDSGNDPVKEEVTDKTTSPCESSINEAPSYLHQVPPHSLNSSDESPIVVSSSASCIQNSNFHLSPKESTIVQPTQFCNSMKEYEKEMFDQLEVNSLNGTSEILHHLPSTFHKNENSTSEPSNPAMIDNQTTDLDTPTRRVVVVNVSLDHIKRKCSELSLKSGKDLMGTKENGPKIKFYSEIDPSKNKSAEAELQKEISKDMFVKMQIVGQFNLGFIITRLGPDLFIVDQHATDEKYNFEMLQLHTTLQNQKLLFPQSLDLTAANESILLDNLEIFLKNGFNFTIEEGEPGKCVKLKAKPVSHNWEFGKEDIDELLFMLQDAPHTMCRPSRVRAMFASRACRKSVMIGTALSKPVMRQLINHMGQLEQPWNCPHGRPTMRHLINLELVKKRR